MPLYRIELYQGKGSDESTYIAEGDSWHDALDAFWYAIKGEEIDPDGAVEITFCTPNSFIPSRSE